MPSSRSLLPWALALTTVACAPREPARWAQGGAVLVLPHATLTRPDDDPVEIRPDGQVFEDGDLVFVVDRVGRVVDPDYEPVALLFPDGRLAGTNDRLLGQVGVSNAAPPDRAEAWLGVMPDGTVMYFAPDGEREVGGRWQGCNGPALRTCTLVTHLLAMRQYRGAPEPGVGIGIGVGVGVGF
jgi:hypothetical protein